MPDPLAAFGAELAISGLGDKTKRTYLAIASSFLRSAGKPPAGGYPRGAYVRYFGALVDARRSPSYIHLHHAALCRLMNALELPPPPLRPRDLPKPNRTTPETWVEPEDISAMVRAVLGDGFDDQARCALALATTYGLRASELRTCELDGDHLLIRVAKSGGHTVRQLIPPAIRPYIMCAPVQHSDYWVQHLYHRLERAAHIPRPRGSRSGFHHIRRALNTALVRQGVPETLIKRFIRWKGSGFSGPLYYLRGDADALDRDVFRRHPFLALWRDAQQAPGRAPETGAVPPSVALAPRNGARTPHRPDRPQQARRAAS